MSYDLFFYKSKDSKITEQDFADYLNKNLPINVSDHPKQWDYVNEETDADFLIDWNEPNSETEDIELFDSFENYTNLNFSCSINFFRPRFFGLEVFPLIDKFVSDLDLFVLNPQDEVDPDTPRKFEKDYLKNQWIQHNDKVTLAQFKELNFEYFPLEKSNNIWWYLSQRKELQDKLGDYIFVCGYFLLKSKEDGKIYTATTWTQHIPIVIPPVDYVIVQKKYKKLFRTVEESGLVKYSTIMSEFKDSFKPFEHEIPDLMTISQIDSDRIADRFNKLEIWKSIKDFGIGIAKGGVVNVKPD